MSFVGFNGAAALVVARVGEANAIPFIVFVFVGVAGAVIAEVVVVPAVVVAEVVILVAAVALFFCFPRSFRISCIIESIFVTNSIDSFDTIRGHACVRSSSLHFKNQSFIVMFFSLQHSLNALVRFFWSSVDTDDAPTNYP
jgi:hypothetical protein